MGGLAAERGDQRASRAAADRRARRRSRSATISTRAAARSMRYYLYRVVNRRAPLMFERGRAWRVKRALDAAAMREAAQALIGRHDFSTFRDAQCQANSPLRTLDASRRRARRRTDRDFDVGARSFLHRQVRSMVGSLVEVGLGKWTRGRSQGGAGGRRPQPLRAGRAAGGLYLARVDYPAGNSVRSDALVDARQRLEIVERGVLVDAVHVAAEQAELHHRADVLDEARVRRAAAGGKLRRHGRSRPRSRARRDR